MAKLDTRTLAERGLDRWGFPLRVAPSAVQAVSPVTVEPDPAPRVVAPAKVTVRTQKGRGSLCDERLILGLRKMCAEAKPGRRYRCREIAAACKVDKETIRLIERQAIRKARACLGPAYFRQLGEHLKRAA